MRSIFMTLFSLFCITVSGQVNLEDGLIARYLFNGNADDNSGNGNNGVLYGPVLTQDRFGNENQAYYFDGDDDFIEVSPVSDVSSVGDFAISVWVNCYSWENQSTPEDGVIDKQYIFDGRTHSGTVTTDFDREGFHVNYTLSENDNEQIFNTILISPSQQYIYPLEIEETLVNKWHHIVFMRKNNETFHYVDGAMVESNVNTDYVLNMQHNWFIGTFSGNNPYYGDVNYNFNGIIDDLSIYNRSLSVNEISSLYLDEPYAIWTNSSNVSTNQNITVPIYTSYLTEANNISAYQFDFEYDETLLEFIEEDLTGTLSENGTIDINKSDPGILRISYMTSGTMLGDSLLLKLNFRTIGYGTDNIAISDFYYNSDPVSDIKNGAINIATIFGDIDGNEEVQAYDASLVLKKSVGLDPIPEIDPLPWESWRDTNADVDNSEGITASDASYILQKSTGNITQFPVEGNKKASGASNDNIEIRHEQGMLNFYAKDGLYGLNIFIDAPASIVLEEPLVLNADFISATNISDSQYNIGLATAYAPENGEKIMEIPIQVIEEGSLNFDLIVNTTYRESSMSFLKTGSNNNVLRDVSVYPNPASDQIVVSGLMSNSEICIYNIEGKQVGGEISDINTPTYNLNISGLDRGIYILKIKNRNSVIMKRIIKE